MFSRKLVIAEVGNNHEGSMTIAKKLILEAKKAGADAVKLQFINPKKFISSNDKLRLNQLKKFSLTKKKFIELKKYADKKKIILFATPFDIDGAIFLNRYQKIFKISSGDNNFFQLMKTVRSFKKPVIISLGMADKKLINEIVKFFRKEKYYRLKKNFCLMHCVSDYPTKKHDINLNTIPYLIKKFNNINIGFSDHTIGSEISKIAYVMGAQIIEKHFTLSNNFSSFRDHKLSLSPANLKKLIRYFDNVDKILGKEEITISENERKNINVFRRKIFLNKNLKKGKILMLKDLEFLRSNDEGIVIDRLQSILNKKIKKNLLKNSLLKKSDIEK